MSECRDRQWTCSRCLRVVAAGELHECPTAKTREMSHELLNRFPCTVEGIEGAVWLYDGRSDEFLVIFFGTGALAWTPRKLVRLVTDKFIDARKAADKFARDHETYPGELRVDGAQPEQDEEGAT